MSDGPELPEGVKLLNAAAFQFVKTAKAANAERVRHELQGVTGPGIETPEDWVVEARRKDAKDFLIWSIEHDAWWAPNHSGYVSDPKEAGRYSFDEAIDIVNNPHTEKPGVPNEAIVLAETYQPRCGNCDRPATHSAGGINRCDRCQDL